MTRCLNLTRSGEYAITALSRLALDAESGGGPVAVSKLAEAQKMPASFLTKILTQCARRGILRAKKGPLGGMGLARPAKDISLLEIVEACQGHYFREACVFYPERPCPGLDCEVLCPLRKEEEKLRERLRRVSLAEMAEALREHPHNEITTPDRR